MIGKLNESTRGAMEAAAGLCLARTHYDIEIEHYLLKLMDAADGDFAAILKAFSVDKARLSAELNRGLDKLKTGNARTPAFSPSLVNMIREAWVIGSLEFEAGEIRSGFTILALLTQEELSRIVRDIGKELQKIDPAVLRKEFAKIVSASHERAEDLGNAAAAGGPAAPRPAAPRPLPRGSGTLIFAPSSEIHTVSGSGTPTVPVYFSAIVLGGPVKIAPFGWNFSFGGVFLFAASSNGSTM